MTKPHLSRRSLLSLAAGASVAACVPFKNTSPFWGTMAAGVGQGAKGTAISRDYTARLPYASMLAWFDGAPQALLVLAEKLPDGRLVWHSAERQSIVTEGPYVAAALGFDVELRGTRFDRRWNGNPLALVGTNAERTLDIFADGRRVQVPLQSRFERRGSEQLELLKVPYTLERVAEKVRSGGRQRFVNDYWVEASSGRTWKSRQTIIPTLPRFNIEVMKYPA